MADEHLYLGLPSSFGEIRDTEAARMIYINKEAIVPARFLVSPFSLPRACTLYRMG